MTINLKLRRIVKQDSRYALEAYEFIFHALDSTMEHLNRRELPDEDSRHISGQELLKGIRRYAVEQFGFLARFVFDYWGVNKTDDFGEIVFNLVNHDLLKKRPEDTKEDFADVYDFTEAFDGAAIEEIHWPTSDG